MENDADKNYPASTPEVAHMMGMSASGAPAGGEHSHAPADGHHAAADGFPGANLPVVDVAASAPAPSHPDPADPEQQHPHMPEKMAEKIAKNIDNPMQIGSEAPVKVAPLFQIAKMVFPFLVVFVVGLFLYFFFFSKVNFGSWFASSAPAPQSVQNTALLQLEKQNLTAYDTWIQSFYYDVSDPAVLDPNADNSGNGLTNFQKYLLDLNPKSYDTLGLGMPDSQALAEGINPLSGQPLTDNQKQIIAKYFDLETIQNKLALDQLDKNNASAAQVLGASTASSTIISTTTDTTGIQNTTMAQEAEAVNANNLDINMSVDGRLQIPSLKIDAPLIWSQSTEDFDKDLLNGVIHYPGTAVPGQIGTTYISGHSSNYPWIKSNFNHIFTHLGDLAVNQSFQITVTLTDGKQAVLHYVVTASQQYSPTDQSQFANTGQSVVALSTCWPVGSTAKRLVVFGQLVQVEQ